MSFKRFRKYVYPRILMAPMNIASMPIQIVNALKMRGFHAKQLSYTLGQGHRFGYEMDWQFDVRAHGGRINAHSNALREVLAADFDIIHFWNRSLFYEGQYSFNSGMDLPLIKARNKRIIYRFTGFDVRIPSRDTEINAYSPFNYGYQHKFPEQMQKLYLEYLTEYVDEFVVQDPEVAQFSPKPPVILPRALNLAFFPYVGIDRNDVPLIVHAPSDSAVKGTKFVERAVEELQDEGLRFRYRRVQNMSHKEAVDLYKQADIIVDQIMIGATGVLTLEALALGKPCVVFLRKDLFEPFYKTRDLPVINANPSDIKSQLKKVIADYDMRQDLSRRGRQLVERFHDVDVVVKQYIGLYRSVIRRTPVAPKGESDVDWLQQQTLLMQDQVKRNRALNRKIDEYLA